MNIPAVQHHAGYPDVYLASRKKLVVTIHAAAGDIKTCELLIFPRTSPEKISSYLMQRVTRDDVRDQNIAHCHFRIFRTASVYTVGICFCTLCTELNSNTCSFYFLSEILY